MDFLGQVSMSIFCRDKVDGFYMFMEGFQRAYIKGFQGRDRGILLSRIEINGFYMFMEGILEFQRTYIKGF